MVGGGLFPSPTVAEKSPTPARKSPTPAEKVQLQSQKGVGLWNIPVNLSSQVHLWSSGLWMLEEYYGSGLLLYWLHGTTRLSSQRESSTSRRGLASLEPSVGTLEESC